MPKVIIVGAGIVGLLAAQALRARGVDFVVLDRDADVYARELAGWAITLHWALDAFLDLVPPEVARMVYAAQVRRDFHLHDSGNFRYINAATGDTVLSIPPSRRLRVRREEVRRALLTGIDVQWDSQVREVAMDGERVRVETARGAIWEGDVLLACDGANSSTRRLVCGARGALRALPLRFCGAKVAMSGAEVRALSERFDPLLFQGTVPATGTFFWFLMLATPEYTGSDDLHYAQVNLSWRPAEDEAFATPEDKARALVAHSEGLQPDLLRLVERAARDPAQLVEIRLADWPDVDWDSHGGRVLLAGDAAHAMTMYRGEACNHGIADVVDFLAAWDAGADPAAMAGYCERVRARAAPAVMLSRQACLDAHDWAQIRPDLELPLLSLRRKVAPPPQ